MISRIIPEMQKASPDVPLKFFAVASPSNDWNKVWATSAIGKDIFATSYHHGYCTQPSDFSAPSLMSVVKSPLTTFMPGAVDMRNFLNSSGVGTIRISADEWGLGMFTFFFNEAILNE